MKIEFNNWQLVDLNQLQSAFSSGFNEFFNIYNSFDPFFSNIQTVSNSRVTGFTYDGYAFDLRGAHFTDSSPLETYQSLTLTNSTSSLLASGSVTYNYNSNAFSGYYDKFSYTSTNTTGLTNLLFTGKAKVDIFGNISETTQTQVNIVSDGYTLSYAGNITISQTGAFSGTVTSFSFIDNLGNKLTVSGISLSATIFDNLTDPLLGHFALNELYGMITDPSRLSGNDTIIGDAENNNISGYAGNDILIGNAGNDVLNGGTGNDTLDGGVGIDTMIGGDGNDTYIVDDVNDIVIETNALSAGGIDLVKSSASFTLSNNVENLTLTDGTTNGGTANINATGNDLKNIIIGNAGNNVIDGGRGADKLSGGLGDDTYIVDLIQTGTTPTKYKLALEDAITEARSAGNDTVELRGDFNHLNASIFTLGSNLENLDASQTGLTKLNLTGNSLDNILTGNDADNILLGAAGNDSLIGGAGNDILDGGTDVDTLAGGTGNDTYLVDLAIIGTGASAVANLQDTIIENNSTTDGIDTLKLRGSAKLTDPSLISLTGLVNIENLDISLTGITKLNLEGNDSDNTLIGNAAANVLTGGLGNDTLNGGKGADTMIGGADDDIYVVDNAGDTIIEAGGEGIDSVQSSISFDLSTKGLNVESLELTGKSAINGTGNDLDNIITGNSASNKLFGNGGDDILNGGAGNDTLNGGTGNDLLIGGAGNDLLIGGLGADTYKWNQADIGTSKKPTIDTISDFSVADNDALDLRDLVQGHSDLQNWLDISVKSGNTEIHVSSKGNFINGNYSAGAEDARIVLSGVDLFVTTSTSNETDLIAHLISTNKLIVD